MAESDPNRFSDFTRKNFRRLLGLAKETYTPRTYTNFKKDERFIILRHDLDTSVEAALKMAKIEYEEGVTATYCLHLHNKFYNLLEAQNTAQIREIQSIGHQIGLHFDVDYYQITNLELLEAWLQRESRFLEELFGQKIRVFSFHNPNKFALGCKDWMYAGLINTYAAYFQDEVGYCSDSNGYWRHRSLEEVLTTRKDKQLQVLLHPEWWVDEPMSPKERMYMYIDKRSTDSKLWYEKTLKDTGRENLDW